MPRTPHLIEKAAKELEHFKFNRSIWQNIALKNLAKESNYSYKQFIKLVNIVKKNQMSKFTVSINYPLLEVYTAIMRVSLKHQKYAEEFKQRIKDLDFIQNIYFSGQRKVTFILRFRALSYKQLKQFTDKIRKAGEDIIVYTNTSLVNKTFIEEGKIYRAGETISKPKVDAVDFEIIRQLQIDAHQPLSVIAKKVNLREPTVHRRIRKLKESGVIVGYHIVRQWKNIPDKFHPIAAFCEINSNVAFDDSKIFDLPSVKNKKIHVRFLYEAFGINNRLFSIAASNMISFRKFVHEELTNMPGVIYVKAYFILESENRTIRFCP
ncbi:Lrp/AsnC family transcriptional regulator [Candidatus Woesearchaeota archaeon]|jgi:Lrp/AsnC family transcriptional regulator, leucine-responsive regulatory protein|nr:Lrp/AsnC family transcriptional regulator [Candidatus Woesearchaeota archaeon]MBT4114022.1 Lrp/AsnC family transcriptional regulator [Candidatus Woesearchaeota archaeon]MBT4248371.1 Lrp/AsnC family transcriptional regulator [Candidatus Woesearchaeota archaeon]